MLRAVAQTSVLPSYTYATLPAANAVPSGYRVRASDIGIAPGMALVSDGTRWIPDGPQVLARSAVAVPHTGTTAKTSLVTITVPGGLLGISGGLRIAESVSYPNNANNKQFFVDFGGTTFRGSSRTTSTQDNFTDILRNRGVANSQFYGLAFTTGASAAGIHATGAIDTTADRSLVLAATLASAADTLIIEAYTVEVLP